VTDRLLVPDLDEEPWPTLGPEVCDFIESNLCYGPGDVLGEPVVLSDELRLFFYRLYEVFPQGHERAGRRRFKRAVLSRRKGVGKTEIAAWIAIAEMDPEGPVRCDGFNADGDPVGRGVRDPYIPMVAVTEEQVEDLAYGAVYEILTNDGCALVDDYDVGLERVMHSRAPGKMQPLASAPSARDGARTTFQHQDETHLFTSHRLQQAAATMERNIPKRKAGDAWTLATTTMFGPGEGSVAESDYDRAVAIHEGRAKEGAFLFDHRQASESIDITTKKGLTKAVRAASGDAWSYTDVDSIVEMFNDPRHDRNTLERYWLNRRRRASVDFVDINAWDRCGTDRGRPEPGDRVVLGFDGSYARDSTVLWGCTVADPHLFEIKAWEKPPGATDWRVNRTDVEGEVFTAMQTWQVVELACDPPGWHREIEEWEAEFGDDVVVRFETKQHSRMGPAVDNFLQAVADRDVTHDRSDVLRRHLSNCVPENRRGYLVPVKADKHSPDKIDAAIGAIIAYHRATWHGSHKADVLTPMAAWV
jgi:hypothetical protein